MTKLITSQETFIIDANVRESHMNRVEVLEKVKGLLLLPNLEMATTKQVADFYEVNQNTLRQLIKEHRDELEQDGLHYKKYAEIKALGNLTPKLNELNALGISVRGNVFPRRAILRVGMLLRDSEIAKEVRTQLLHRRETSEAKVADIDEEIQLQMAIGQAFMSGDINALAHASEKLIDFKSRHITKIENKLQEQKR